MFPMNICHLLVFEMVIKTIKQGKQNFPFEFTTISCNQFSKFFVKAQAMLKKQNFKFFLDQDFVSISGNIFTNKTEFLRITVGGE